MRKKLPVKCGRWAEFLRHIMEEIIRSEPAWLSCPTGPPCGDQYSSFTLLNSLPRSNTSGAGRLLCLFFAYMCFAIWRGAHSESGLARKKERRKEERIMASRSRAGADPPSAILLQRRYKCSWRRRRGFSTPGKRCRDAG